jgi:hypothetical protein
MIRTLRRVSCVQPLTRGLAHTTSAVIFVVVAIVVAVVSIHHTIDTLIALPIYIITHLHTGTTAGTSTLPLVVASQSIASSKSTTAFGALVVSLACVQFLVSLEIVQPTKARLTLLALKRLLLAVC